MMGVATFLVAVALFCIDFHSGSADSTQADHLDKLGYDGTSNNLSSLADGRSCLYNGELFNNGDVVLVAEEACVRIVCQVLSDSNAQLSTSSLKLLPLENCQCRLPTKRALGLPSMSGFKETLKKAKKKVSKKFGLTKNKDVGGCYYNGRLVMAGGIADGVPLGCSQLKCEKAVLDGSLKLSLFVNQECSCSVVTTTQMIPTGMMTDDTATGMMTDDTTTGTMTDDTTTWMMTDGMATQQITDSTSPFPETTDAATTPSPCSQYAQFSHRHTMCLSPNPRCSVRASGITAAEKNAILYSHNFIRALMATGIAEAGSYGSLPPSSNMKELKWNQELADIALAWARQCPSDHDCYNCRVPVSTTYSVTGQNIYKTYGIQGAVDHDVTSLLGNIPKWENAIGAWSNESLHVDVSVIRSFRPRVTGKVVGHFSQVVWAETAEIGCGSTTYGPCTDESGTGLLTQCEVFVCNYGPAGNYVGERIYMEGLPATMCEHGRATQFGELCNP